ncbi:DUF2945 domain-containing protein [Streptacidiphilus sp. PB12-B1b]|uniref:DUF2945 domain-containing protein n=1 Tax=Streptacidiphilus sp. PB12-B1b TaxID=2705012 RepID=UPI0015F94DD5|nr:DUF2945 domain-containing protein [Streptacidiphilus sp. PB12-B1b]QMU77329.1 DUF2945 domain-containing protein [Streptacidiphilus sp. PB12-B1b]
MAKHAKITEGDRVSWRSHGSTAIGTVKRKLTGRGRAAGRTVAASPQEPQYVVESEKSGGTAVHKPQALTKRAKKERS